MFEINFKKDENFLKGIFRPVKIFKIHENVVNIRLIGHFNAIFTTYSVNFEKAIAVNHCCWISSKIWRTLQTRNMQWARYLWIYPRRSTACHTACALLTWWLPECAPAADQSIRYQKYLGNSCPKLFFSNFMYRQTCNISRTLVGIKLVITQM